MTILGIFLNKEMRTGANRRYLELMESLAAKGNRVYVIMNTLLEYTPVSFTKIPLTVPYKRRGFPPASFLFRKAVKRCYDSEIRPVLEQAGGVEWVHIHGDMHLNAALYLCSVTGAPLFYAFRCNDITRARILRKSGSLSFREYLFSLLYEQVNRRREKLVARKARLTAFQNICDRDLYCERTGADKNTTVIIPGNIGLPRCIPEWENANKETSPEKLVFAGGVSLSKGLFHMLQTLSLVMDNTGRKIHLSVLGRGSESDLAAAKEAAEGASRDRVINKLHFDCRHLKLIFTLAHPEFLSGYFPCKPGANPFGEQEAFPVFEINPQGRISIVEREHKPEDAVERLLELAGQYGTDHKGKLMGIVHGDDQEPVLNFL